MFTFGPKQARNSVVVIHTLGRRRQRQPSVTVAQCNESDVQSPKSKFFLGFICRFAHANPKSKTLFLLFWFYFSFRYSLFYAISLLRSSAEFKHLQNKTTKKKNKLIENWYCDYSRSMFINIKCSMSKEDTSRQNWQKYRFGWRCANTIPSIIHRLFQIDATWFGQTIADVRCFFAKV